MPRNCSTENKTKWVCGPCPFKIMLVLRKKKLIGKCFPPWCGVGQFYLCTDCIHLYELCALNWMKAFYRIRTQNVRNSMFFSLSLILSIVHHCYGWNKLYVMYETGIMVYMYQTYRNDQRDWKPQDQSIIEIMRLFCTGLWKLQLLFFTWSNIFLIFLLLKIFERKQARLIQRFVWWS